VKLKLDDQIEHLKGEHVGEDAKMEAELTHSKGLME
jgi:hypothetical protein